MTDRLRAIDLCCGAGGWACAARGLPIEWVAVADIAKGPLETWLVNHQTDHPDCKLLQVDLSTAAGVEAILDACGSRADLVVGGIPCEQVSCLRMAKPLERQALDDWHRLIDCCLLVVEQTTPRWWCIEDVIQIEKHLPPPLFHGREIPRRRIDASDYGPQRRVRTFLGEFPAPRPRRSWGARLGDCLRPGPHLTIPEAERYEALTTETGDFGVGFVGDGKVRVLDPAKPAPTVVAGISKGSRQRRGWLTTDSRGRRRLLSWQELAAIQGFPEDYLFAGGYTAAEAMIGRAIPIQVGRAIFEAIVAEWRNESQAEESVA